MEDKEQVKGRGEIAGQATGTPDAAKCPRPVFVHETDAEEMPDFNPSPRLYTCACAFVFDNAVAAFENGDNDLLSRDGVAVALRFLSCPENAGTDAAAVAEMMEDWREERAARLRAFKKFDGEGEAARILRRAWVWGVFDETKTPDAQTMRERVYFLRSPQAADLIRLVRGLEKSDIDYYNRMTDAIIYGRTDGGEPPRARMIADWLNDRFSTVGEELARWVSVAALPDYAESLAEIKKRIADNYGVFPAPFGVVDGMTGERVEMARDELAKLCYIAFAIKRDKERAATEKRAKAIRRGLERAHESARTVERVYIMPSAANPSGAPVKQKAGRNVGKISGAAMAGLMGRSLSIIRKWEAGKAKPPVVDGKTYTKDIRENGAGAFVYAARYKDTLKGALKTVGGDKGAGMAEREAAQKWVEENAAALRSVGANLSEWE